MDRTVVLAGAGLSAMAQLPTTSQLLQSFLEASRASPFGDAISAHLQKYWRDVFGWQKGRKTPSFENHFTTLDLSANTGHCVGRLYNPAQLRAIRRLSLHRVFETLDQRFQNSGHIQKLVDLLATGDSNTVLSTNWDIVIERHCREANHAFHYGVRTEYLDRRVVPRKGLGILKLHGSSNWCYCDSCRRLFAYTDGKGVLKDWLFLEARDFRALGDTPTADYLETNHTGDERKCPYCDIRVSTRVATFSFDKALGFYQFQGVWEDALRTLREAERWIFVGYSLPEADFQLRHVLKTAQLAGPATRNLVIEVVVKRDNLAVERYKRFFGARVKHIYIDGFADWIGGLPA
ncbi:MAG: hypothetical protein JSR36_15350 [Proteobacteria bacterium]|nr:hypothetical protein [Pseudomonadota bacterium]